MNVWSDKSFNYMHHKTDLPRLALQFASHSDVIFLCILSFCCCHCCVVWFYWMAQGSKSFSSLKQLGVILLPPGWDASPSQGYPSALNLPVPIYTPGWREALWEKNVLHKDTTQCPQPGLKPRPLAPESSALTMRILPPNGWYKEVVIFAN